MSLSITRLGATRTLYEAPRGTVELWVPAVASNEATGLTLLMRCTGHGCASFADPILSTFDRVLARGKPVVFDDWEEVTGYDTELRVKLTAWRREHETQVEKTHILVRSRILAMGVAVANLAVGGSLEVYASRDKFERQLVQRVPAYIRPSVHVAG